MKITAIYKCDAATRAELPLVLSRVRAGSFIEFIGFIEFVEFIELKTQ